MAERFRVGPCRVMVADHVTDPVSEWVDLGETRGDIVVQIAPGRYSLGRADQFGMTPLAAAVWSTGPQASCTVALLEHSLAKLLRVFPGSVLTTGGGETALGFGSGFARIALAAIPTLILLPVDQVTQGTNGINADDMVVLPAAIARDIGQFTFNLPDGEDVFSPHEVQFAGLLRDADQGAAAIPAAHRAIFYGPPLALGLTWFLPTATP